MKRIKLYLVLFLVTFLLSSCFWGNNDDVLDAKKDMGIITQDNSGVVNGSGNIDTGGLLDNLSGEKLQEDKKIQITYLTDDKFLEFDDLSEKNLLGGEVEITGITLTNVDKIIVNFSNKTSDYPDDTFTLTKFNSGDETFLYRAFSRFETLDFGKNEYIFEAYSGTKVSKVLLVINVVKEEDKEIGNVELIDIKNLPVGGDFGDPKELGNGKITYSDLKGLEIQKITDKYFDCGINSETDNYYVSEYLDKISGSYYWWNTCRPLGNNIGISYFVLKLDGVDYKYEKHIFLPNGIYGIYELESGVDLVLEDDSVEEKNNKLKVKNDELKDKNDEYENLDIISDLFEKLANN